MRSRRSRRLRAPTIWAAAVGLVTAGLAVPVTATPALAATACQVTYTVQSSWSGGFTAAVKITNLGDAWTSWNLGFSFPGNQRISQGWSATWTQAAGSAAVTAQNASWNGSVATNGSVDLGFNATFTGTNTAPTAFTVNGTPCTGPNVLPAVRLTAPAAGSTYTAPATVPITAEALDSDGTISQVDFYAGTALIGTDTTSPYAYSWTNVPAGTFSLTAKATDNKGGVTTSAPVGITVGANTGPAVVVSPATVTVPEGGTRTFTVALSSAPTANTTVAVARTAGDTDVTVSSGASLTFSTTNWSTAQTVTLAAAEDSDNTAGVATITASSTGRTSGVVTATEVDNDQSAANQRFIEMYNEIHDPANGYFSPEGIPYHSIETLLVEAPDHGHETTSEAFSYFMWLEASYGRATGDWTKFNNAWAVTERYIIPSHADQPTNSFYNASKPATYAPESPNQSDYPAPLDTSVPVGSDPIAAELNSAYGTPDIYGMHWLLDVDNVYGFGHCGDGTTRPAYINTYQRGSSESVWETVPQPSCDTFAHGGPNGYLDLFTGDSAYAKQWKYTNAPDADARAVQAAYWALKWATAQGKQSQVSDAVAKAAKMGDYLRYSFFDKYFKQIGNCTSPSCPAGSGKNSAHYLLSWYYAWGGALDTNAGWAWRIGDGANHQGYQNPLAAYALSNVAALAPKSATGKADWATSLTRQLQFYQWLQSSEGAIAGGATNSWDGRYASPPSGLPTFYGMYYDVQPVWHDPPSNRWFGFQAWSMERVAAYYNETGNATAKAILDKWVTWALANTTFGANGAYAFPNDLSWSGTPAGNYSGSGTPAANTGLHVTVQNTTNDVGVAGSYAKVLSYYAARSGNAAAKTAAQNLLDALWLHRDDKGIAIPETRTDYNRFDDTVYIPAGWSGTMPNGDAINSSSTFISIRSFYRNDPQWSKVQAYLNGGAAPSFTYHRFWAQADIATAYSVYAELFG